MGDIPLKPSKGHERTNDEATLKDFILKHQSWVEEKVLQGVRRNVNSDISKALEQIHQNSLSCYFSHNKGRVTSRNNHQKVLIDFILSHDSLVAREVMLEARKGDDKAINLALEQIHLRSLEMKLNPPCSSPISHTKSFKEALMDRSKIQNEMKDKSKEQPPKTLVKGEFVSKTLFISGFPEDT